MKSTVKYVAYKVLGTTLLATALIGCGTANENSETKVTNGSAVADTTYPSVVRLVTYFDEQGYQYGICTGTFINDSQVITAGHCVEEAVNSGNPTYLETRTGGKRYRGIQALSYKRNPSYDIRNGVSPYDIAIINFPANSAPAVSQLASVSPSVGDTLTIVGYGNNVNRIVGGSLSGSGAGPKRVGTNSVGAVSEGFIKFAGLSEADGQSDVGTDVASGSGDSGGPLFVNGKLAGITSGGGLRSDGQGGYYSLSLYVDVNNSSAKAFLKSAVKK